MEIVGVDGLSAIWVYELSGSTQIRRLTRSQDGNNTHPIWTHNSERLTFASDRSGVWQIYRQPSDGFAEAEQLTTGEEGWVKHPDSWSVDEEFLSYTKDRIPPAPQTQELWMLSLSSGDEEVFYNLPDSSQCCSAFSPDGNWIAYSSTEGGIYGVYVEPFPQIPGVQYEIVKNGEIYVSWSPDGSELFYAVSNASGRPPAINRVEVRTEPSFAVTNEEAVVENFLFVPYFQNYDVTLGSERVLAVLPADQAEVGELEPQQINIVLNWFEELKDRVPIP